MVYLPRKGRNTENTDQRSASVPRGNSRVLTHREVIPRRPDTNLRMAEITYRLATPQCRRNSGRRSLRPYRSLAGPDLNPAGREKLGSIGVPLLSTEMKCAGDQGNEVAIGEPGEIIARGPQVMQGYWKQPEETKQVLRGGWLFTGDIGKMDADGYFSVVDRRKDMILVSGFKVYPNEVEAVLAGLAGVKECAAIRPSTPPPSAISAGRELATYKGPKFVEFRDDLPKSNVGKILRRDLRQKPPFAKV
jgi:acyl-CoA synthetase (AMP-forming)/AMP-acid ligase II